MWKTILLRMTVLIALTFIIYAFVSHDVYVNTMNGKSKVVIDIFGYHISENISDTDLSLWIETNNIYKGNGNWKFVGGNSWLMESYGGVGLKYSLMKTIYMNRTHPESIKDMIAVINNNQIITMDYCKAMVSKYENEKQPNQSVKSSP